MSKKMLELGVGMFGDLKFNQKTGKFADAGEEIRNIIEEIKLSDELGLDVFGLGEHHRPDYSVSSPEIVLAAAASVTKNIKLASTVTVLSSAEPVKVYEDFATLDLISNGRAEIYIGRGSFTESFPLYGYDLRNYDELFEEKFGLFQKINNSKNVTWMGNFRGPMINQTVYPRASRNGQIPIWIASGGNQNSIIRAAKLGIPLTIAIIGGRLIHFQSAIELYKNEYLNAGNDPAKMQIGVHSHTFISENPEVIENHFYDYGEQTNRVGKSRNWPPFTKLQYEAGMSPEGVLFFGNSSQVLEKMKYMQKMYSLTRFIAHMDMGAPSHEDTMESIKLFATKVAPEIRNFTK